MSTMMMMQRSSRLVARVAAVCAQQPLLPRNIAFYSSATNAGTGGSSSSSADAAPQPAPSDAQAKATEAKAAPSSKKKKSSPMQNLKDVMDALDIMIEEAEKKVVKKYRPNMFAEFKQLNDTNGKVRELFAVRCASVSYMRALASLTFNVLLL